MGDETVLGVESGPGIGLVAVSSVLVSLGLQSLHLLWLIYFLFLIVLLDQGSRPRLDHIFQGILRQVSRSSGLLLSRGNVLLGVAGIRSLELVVGTGSDDSSEIISGLGLLLLGVLLSGGDSGLRIAGIGSSELIVGTSGNNSSEIVRNLGGL